MAIPPKAPAIPRSALEEEAKRRGIEVEVVPEAEQKRRLQELLKCWSDPVYWIKTYVKTYDPRDLDNPFIPFDLYPRQVELIEWLEERLKTQTPGVVEKSKDVGVSWIVVTWMLHKWLTRKGFAGGLGSRKLEYVDSIGDPKSLFEKLRMILRNLPSWMMPQGFEWKKHSLECRLLNPSRGSTIVGEGGVDIGRGGRSTVYAVDEYNKLEHPELADAALRDNSNVLLYLGTPNGLQGIYEKRGHWPCFTFHWKDDPRKNLWRLPSLQKEGSGREAPLGAVYPWYETQVQKHKDQPWIIKQEIDIDYLGSGFPRFDREYLAELLEAARTRVPIYVEIPGQSSWSAEVTTWKEPRHGHRYVIVCDVAEGESTGDDPDWSVGHVYDLENWEQVCVYRGRPDTHAYAVDLAALGEMYDFAELCIERTGPGLSTIKTLTEEIGYAGGLWSNADKPGFMATARTKVEAEAELGGYIADMKEGFRAFVWNDPVTLEELIHYVVKPNGRTEAEAGWHDDHVSVARMAAVVLPQVAGPKRMNTLTPNKPAMYYAGGRRR